MSVIELLYFVGWVGGLITGAVLGFQYYGWIGLILGGIAGTILGFVSAFLLVLLIFTPFLILETSLKKRKCFRIRDKSTFS